jgi:hypothetical protein
MNHPPPIDLVYTCVFGSHTLHQNMRNYYSVLSGAPIDLSQEQRFRCSGEIYASIETVWKYAQWIRKVWVIVDDCQLRLFDHTQVSHPDKVQIIPHSTVFRAMTSHLPTYNSQAIETHLADIPGLAELFMYANDDTFFGSPCQWTDFYTKTASSTYYPKLLLSNHTLETSATSLSPLWVHSRANNSKLLDLLNTTPRTRLSLLHQIRPLCKSLYREAWTHPLILPSLTQTSASKFRSLTDIEPVGLLLQWGLQRGLLQVATGIRSFYIGIDNHLNLSQLNLRPYHLYCLNDIMDNPSPERLKEFQQWLKGDHVATPYQRPTSRPPAHRKQTISLDQLFKALNNNNVSYKRR